MTTKQTNKTGELERGMSIVLGILATGMLMMLDYLGVFEMARLGKGIQTRWRALAEEGRSRHA